MKAEIEQALLDTFDYLQLLNDEKIPPKEAQKRLQTVRTQNPLLIFNLLWEEEVYDGSIHYDVLIRLADEEGTISLSYCPDRALPWPMRGVHRWSENELVRVNNTVLKIDQAIACIDFIWDEKRIIDRLIKTCLVQEALDENPIELTDDELQFAMNGFRRTHRLYTAEATYAWLERNGVTHQQLEERVTDEAKIIKLREQIASDRVDGYFEAHQADFDRIQMAQIAFADPNEAQQVAAQIQNGDLDFYQAAQDSFLTDQALSNSLFTTLSRREAPEELLDIFDAAPNTVLGPIEIDERYLIVYLLSTTPAVRSVETEKLAQKILFEEWVEERRQAAKIEWNWGRASQTNQDNSLE